MADELKSPFPEGPASTVPTQEGKDYGQVLRSLLLKRASEGTPTGVPEIPIWQPPGGWADQNIPIQTDTPNEKNINDLMTKPADWDYKTAVLGMNKEKLPEDAIGWTPHGTPYYGDGLEGWWKGTVSRMTAPISYEDETIIPEEGTWWQKTLGTIENLGAQFYHAAGEEGGVPSPLTYVTRGVSELFKSVFTGLEEAEIKTEQVFGVARGVEERAAEEFGLPEPEYKSIYEGFNPFQEFNSFTSPRGWAFKLGLMLGAKDITTDEGLDLIKEGYNSGRIFYSSIVDPLVADEYKRRYRDGENPYLLAMELENPMAEMVGRMVISPWNLFGLGARGVKDTRRLGSLADEFFRIPDEIDNVLRGAGEVDEIAAVSKIQELAEASIKSLDDLGHDYRLGALTADGKRYVIDRRTGELAEWTLRTNSGNDPDKAMEILEGVIALASDDTDEVARGISMIKGASIEPRPYFSRAGQELSAVLRNLVVDDAGKLNPGRFLDELAKASDGGIDDVVELVSKSMNGTIEKMFPTVTERLAAGEKLPWHVAQLSRFDKFAQKSVYRPINTFFAGIYMGLSPGYAMRNFFTNTLHVLVDGGPGAMRFKTTPVLDKTSKWLGGQLPDIAGFGKGVMGVETIESISRRLPFSKLSEKWESLGAIQVVSKSVQDTMRKMLRPGKALPDIAPLVNAGMDPESAGLLMRLVVDNYGDVKKATTAFKGMVSNGSVDAFRTLEWLGEGNRAALYGFNMGDEVLDALRNATSRDDAFARVNALFDDVIADGARVADEAPAVSEMNEAASVVNALGNAKATGVDISDDLIRASSNHVAANSHVNEAFYNAVRQELYSAQERLMREGADLTDLEQLWKKYAPYLNDSWKANAKNESDEFTAVINAWNDRILASPDSSDFKSIWREIGIEGEPPSILGKAQLRKILWEEHFFPKQREMWTTFRETFADASENILEEVWKISPAEGAVPRVEKAQEALAVARRWDLSLTDKEVRFALERAAKKGDNALAARIRARQHGISSITEEGVPLDQKLLNIINTNLPEEMDKFDDLAKVPPEVSHKAILQHTFKDLTEEAAPARSVWDIPDEQLRVPDLPTVYEGNTPTMARVIEQSTDGLHNLQQDILRGIDNNWGRRVPQGWSANLEREFTKWARGAEKGVARARLTAVDVANATRDFTMLSYPQKKYFDLALAYIYPYHFWYNRTYSNWLRRVATNPEVLSAYGKYKNTLAKIHAGAPEWWKYNINTNELLGIESENPLFFNLESTLNPLNGLTGVDFNDSKKRVNWFTAILDDMNKFGPSTWTPFSIATAWALSKRGEEEAASRWGGRLIPQTAVLKNLTALMNIGPPGGVELDPSVNYFSGGIDPYERRQVGRALYGLQEEGVIDGASAMDAAYYQEGEAWDMARDVRSHSRSLGQLTSFIFGTGFKARKASDIEIDKFDAQFFNLWALEPNMTPDEFQQAMDEMRKDYPFMDAVLLSRKAGQARDRGYAYNVLGRIPPGQKDDIAEAAGLERDFINLFYADKGHIEEWEETDRQRFMAFVVDVGALLDMPDDATKKEWTDASARYKLMTEDVNKYFGEDIEDLTQQYFDLRKIDEDRANEFMNANPVLGQALTWKDATMINDPLLSRYYVAIKNVERYYNGVMYDAIRHEFGDEIYDIQDGYFAAKLVGNKEAKQYLKEHPELTEKWDMQDDYEKITTEMIVDVEKMIRSDVHPFLRAGAEARSLAQQNIMDVMTEQGQSPYELGWEDFRTEMSVPLQNLVEDYVLLDEDLSGEAYKQLEYLAGDFGMNYEKMMELISRSMTGQQVSHYGGPAGESQPQPYNFAEDDRLTTKAKETIRRHVIEFKAEAVEPTLETTGVAFALPESIARREESGFRRFGMSARDPSQHTVYQHELAHTIDFVDEVSGKKGFQNDLWRWAKEKDSSLTSSDRKAVDDGAVEWWAYLFTHTLEGGEMPNYLKKWFDPYIK